MGVQLSALVHPTPTEFSALDGHAIAIDALNTIFQFLSIIRQRDGTPLMDSKGRVTSHLTGLFYRNANLIDYGIRPAFVFDGEAPVEKKATQKSRRDAREEAKRKWESAKRKGDLAAARKYAQASSELSDEMVEGSKKLLSAMGIPVVQAPGEGEAQAALMCRKKHVWAVGSQDYDAVVYATPRLLRNLTVTGKRKVPGKDEYIEIKPEIIELSSVLTTNRIDHEQLILIALLIGNDYEDGINGVGPKRALDLAKKYPTLEKLQRSEEVGEKLEAVRNIEEVYQLFKHPNVTRDYKLSWEKPDAEQIKKILCDQHDFSEDRVANTLKKLTEREKAGRQTRLDSF